MDYEKLHPEQFDALVTGELTHFGLWFEDELVGVICDYFVGDTPLRNDFLRLLMRREGLTFQDKIEIVRALVPVFPQESSARWTKLLKRIEDFKALRNAAAHGVGAAHDLSHLAERAESLGLPPMDRRKIEQVQCSPGVRYDIEVSLDEAIAAHVCSVDLCAHIAPKCPPVRNR